MRTLAGFLSGVSCAGPSREEETADARQKNPTAERSTRGRARRSELAAFVEWPVFGGGTRGEERFADTQGKRQSDLSPSSLTGPQSVSGTFGKVLLMR